MKALSLFTGAGGLDLGLQAAGFEIAGCVERDHDCRATIEANTDWRIANDGDVETLDATGLLAEFDLREGDVTLLAGGPPCQPFSKSGQWVSGKSPGMADPRSHTLHAYFDILEAVLPTVMLLENVKGLAAKPREGSDAEEALEMLAAALELINRRHGTAYRPSVIHVDAADVGVPQKRERVFVVAERNGASFTGLAPTHGHRAPDGSARHSTAWDALGDLDAPDWDPELTATGQWAGLLPSIPEGRNYLHHTRRGDGEALFGWRRKYWSFLLKLAKDRPSWTIQAQPGPATGPFHWRNRKLSIREMARLQTFPDTHDFAGTYHSARRQIGNAVPVALAEYLALEIRRELLDDDHDCTVTNLPHHRADCPPAEDAEPVPAAYLSLRGEHEDHPGVGEGPRAREIRAAAAVAA
jgi:DNA (cytosine-5)-methyltransferase 1